MAQRNKGRMQNSESVQRQLNELENKNNASKNKKGSTNEIQPISNEDGLTQ
ncbi:hypothetical protein [Peribacillus deserti]|uniref:hypothetical protein n=1 Tax=Peribacillus deserti TaxID=673318 RepID=UPI0015E0858C|nr:hypothetical protein [Peribacillus deserti]